MFIIVFDDESNSVSISDEMNDQEVDQRLRRAAELQDAAELANPNPQNWETRLRMGNDVEEVIFKFSPVFNISQEMIALFDP